MNFIGKLKDLQVSYFEKKASIIIETKDVFGVTKEYEKIKNLDRLNIEIKQYREKRSLDANAYCWKLITELANVNRTSKDEVYLEMLKRYGQSEIVSVLSKVNVKGYFKYFDEVGKSNLNFKEFTHYKVYKGSSEYDTREMSILIDGVVSECKELGIETLTPDELRKMKESWCVTND